ncbi:transposase [Chryseobacterium antibioticum]|uniref:transposase n=1 Tax=Chryseobacterium antibioticum TaxID=2728847 RepID=UPI00293C0475|nr:transposase [Chryseobacterium antibioticum]
MFFYEFIDQRPIIYLDESGFAMDAPRPKGYSLKGARCYGAQDWHSRGRVNAIGAIHRFKMLNVYLFDGNINADVFYSWVTQQLLSSLPERAVIVMDNATFHKRSDSIEAIESKGHNILFLPPYSPDLNPIEKKWAQAKSIRKKSGVILMNFLLIF